MPWPKATPLAESSGEFRLKAETTEPFLANEHVWHQRERLPSTEDRERGHQRLHHFRVAEPEQRGQRRRVARAAEWIAEDLVDRLLRRVDHELDLGVLRN